jgi:hypothetical protein
MSSYFPGPDALFDGFAVNTKTYVENKTTGTHPAWENIPADAVTGLSDAVLAFHSAYAIMAGAHTPADTEWKTKKRKEAEAVIRGMVNQYLRFPPVTDEDRIKMNIPNKDTTYTKQPVPTNHVGFVLEINAVYSLKIRFWELETQAKGVPKGMNGVVVNWKVSDTPITDQALLTESRLLSRHIEVLHFEPHERGKTVYAACRWENIKGERGEWSPIQSFVVP